MSGNVKTVDALLKGSGKDWPEILRSLAGNFSLDIQSGSIDMEKLKRGVRRLFSAIPQPNLLEKDASFSFKHISGDFVAKDGVFETQNFVIETENRRTSIVGTFDLVNNQMDTVVGIAPLAGLDRFLTQIPVVGKIITGGDEKSILKTYYTVKGDFNDPDAYIASAKRAAAIGIEGKWAIHPSQIDLANKVFSPPEAEVNKAKRILEELDKAAKEGKGAAQLDGRMIDAASARMAENIVNINKRIQGK